MIGGERVNVVTCRVLVCVHTRVYAARHGVQRTGLFCAIMNMMDQLVNDNEVDVYDAVKRVRQARPEFVDNIVRLFTAQSLSSLLLFASSHFTTYSASCVVSLL